MSKPNRKTVELVKSSYQPTKREREETFATNASFEQAVDAVLRPVKVRWIDLPRKRRRQAVRYHALGGRTS